MEDTNKNQGSYYYNNGDCIYFFPEINKKVEPKKQIYITDEEISKSELLTSLVTTSVMVMICDETKHLIPEEDSSEEMTQKSQKADPFDTYLNDPDQGAVNLGGTEEVLENDGRSQEEVSLNPNKVNSRMSDFKKESDKKKS